ncbi:hypothetical protein NPIL_433401, partial [Nephila pilipes]
WSLLEFSQGTGAGGFSGSFSFYFHVGTFTTHFDGKFEAIHLALQQSAARLDSF